MLAGCQEKAHPGVRAFPAETLLRPQKREGAVLGPGDRREHSIWATIPLRVD